MKRNLLLMSVVIACLFALPVAILLASGGVDGRRGGIGWNIFGLLDFTVAIAIGRD